MAALGNYYTYEHLPEGLETHTYKKKKKQAVLRLPGDPGANSVPPVQMARFDPWLRVNPTCSGAAKPKYNEDPAQPILIN